MIAIDGPAGSGKSTVASRLARRLQRPHIDTGAIYRTLTLLSQRAGIPSDDGPAIAKLARRIDIDMGGGKILLDGTDITRDIRSSEVTKAVSTVAAHPEVRQTTLEIQRQLVPAEGAVVEGRDIGTVVLPDAELKIFLTADPQERARRRAAELQSEGKTIDEKRVLDEMQARDRIDTDRSTSPLRPADDAVVLDTTGKDADAVVQEILDILKERGDG